MIRAFLSLSLLMILATAAAGRNNLPVFDTIITTATITESDSVNWYISASDPDGDSILIYLLPPTDDPIYKGGAFFINVEETWNFQFQPSYDFIDSGQVDLPMTFYATDFIDTVSMPVTITVIDSNPAPILDPIADYRILEGVLFTLPISAHDPDGTIPVLDASPLPANASFVDSLNGVGLFTFLPDATQYGDSALDYSITFSASDNATVITKEVTITVVGPNQPPVLGPIGELSVLEGESLNVAISAADPDGTFPELTTSPLPDNAELALQDSGRAVFKFTPDYRQAGTYYVTFYAGDGKSIDSENVTITVTDAGNQAPVFDSIPEAEAVEGGDPLLLTITARDLDNDPVTLTMLDTLENSNFTDNGNGTGLFVFAPDLAQGGTHTVRFQAVDNLQAAGEITVTIKVAEADFPPGLLLDPGVAQTISEGMRLRIDLTVADSEQVDLPITMFPPADSAVFKGNAVLVDYGDGTGYFEFAPDYGHLQGKSDTTYVLAFSTKDSVQTTSKEIVVTVYNVTEDNNDPMLPDTLTLVGTVWDTLIPGFVATVRIWNDSSIAAAITGFRWSEPWLRCDSISFSERLDSAQYRNTMIFNDSLDFVVSFLYWDFRFLRAGNGEYFKAYFSYDSSLVDVDTIPEIRIDTAKIGNRGDFVFDKRVRESPVPGDPALDLELLAKTDFTYRPLVKLGPVRTAGNRIKMQLVDKTTGLILGRGNAITAVDSADTPYVYELQIGLENASPLGEFALGFRVFSDDGAMWAYVDSPASNLLPVSRMFPDLAVWPQSSGLQVAGFDIDSTGIDSIMIHGVAGIMDTAGLAAGLMEPMIAIPFRIAGMSEGELKTIRFDTATISGEPSSFLFADRSGNPISPDFSGGLSYPIIYKKIIVDVDPVSGMPTKFSLSQNYPNPFNPTTTIVFDLPSREHVTIAVYNILGQIVTTLADKIYNAGTHYVIWDGSDQDGHPAATGLYLYRMECKGVAVTRKMLLLK